jgi:formylglycine-generating enzyme required for sulfatase activity
MRIELNDLHTIAANLRVELYRAHPATNTRQRLDTYDVGTSPTVRIIAPAANLLVSITGTYRDGKSRAINFHLDHSPTWSFRAKRVTLRAPTAADVRRHPSMAFVPAGDWREGEERRPAKNAKRFWIDIAPVTVEAYLPLARRFANDGTIDASVLLHDIAEQGGTEATGMSQLPQMMGDLAAVLSVIDAAERPVVRPERYEDTAAMLPRIRIACPTCPAPMTLHEARAYCRSRGMRLPARSEWEFAARGADGRRFPWGDAWNDAQGNAGLPAEVGKPKRPEPSAQYVSGASPFGVIDMVGNEGDWIEPDGGYERMFVGGLYRFNADDCTVFAETPNTGEMLPLYEVTCRCVSP